MYNIYKGKPNTLKELLQIANQVFEDSRIAAYAVIKGIAVHNWGLKVSNNNYIYIYKTNKNYIIMYFIINIYIFMIYICI